MTLGALVDLGVPVEAIEQRLKALPIGPFSLRAEKINRQGIMGTRVHVEVVEDEHTHRHLRHILEIMEAADLPSIVADRARLAYTALADAEATVHGSTREKIHFHEVGAKDAILDVAGAMVGIELLGAKTFSCGPIVTGSGMVKCMHGLMPVPAPATAELLTGMVQKPGQIESELVTPTGAAILRTLLDEADSQALRDAVVNHGLNAEKVGYGAGGKTFEGQANYLRLMLCEAPRDSIQMPRLPVEAHRVLALETEIDDMSPEVAGYLMDRLLADGAYDVQFSPVQMKKNRPALRLRVLCAPECEGPLAERIFRETSTFGLRRLEMERWCLARRIEKLETPLGSVAVKLGLWGDQLLKASPEYEDCRALAEATGRPLAEIYELARRAARDKFETE